MAHRDRILAALRVGYWCAAHTPLWGVEGGYRLHSSARSREKVATDRLKEYMEPRLELSYDPADADLVIDERALPARRVRVKVKNISGVTISNVVVELMKVDPPIQRGVLPMPLLHKDWRSDVLNPGQTLPVDAFYKDARQNFVVITHGIKNATIESARLPPISRRDVWLKVSGENCADMESVHLVLYVTDDGLISLHMAG